MAALRARGSAVLAVFMLGGPTRVPDLVICPAPFPITWNNFDLSDRKWTQTGPCVSKPAAPYTCTQPPGERRQCFVLTGYTSCPFSVQNFELHPANPLAMPDGDQISVYIDRDVVNPQSVEIVLNATPAVTWYKSLVIPIIIPSGRAAAAEIWTENQTTQASLTVPANTLGGLTIAFRKAKLLGERCLIYSLPVAGRIPAGARVTFSWAKD